jgi:hypothetical protein
VVLPDGRVLAVRAAGTTGLVGDPDGAVPVIVNRARPAEVSALLVDAYGLTRRQREMLGHILRQPNDPACSHARDLRPHRPGPREGDLRRLSVSRRSELSARLQFEQYDPRVWADVAPSPYGGFLEAPSASGGT